MPAPVRLAPGQVAVRPPVGDPFTSDCEIIATPLADRDGSYTVEWNGWTVGILVHTLAGFVVLDGIDHALSHRLDLAVLSACRYYAHMEALDAVEALAENPTRG